MPSQQFNLGTAQARSTVERRGPAALAGMSGAALLLALALALGAGAYTRNAVWRSDLSLWSDSAAKSPGVVSSLNNLGMAYYDLDRLDDALAVFTRIMERHPRFGLAPMGVANVLGRRGDHAAAVGLLERARALMPHYWAIHYNLGNEYLLLDRLDEAEASYRQALMKNDSIAGIYHNLGALLSEARQAPGRAWRRWSRPSVSILITR